MDARSIVTSTIATQNALVIANSIIQIASYLWQPEACVSDNAVYDYIVVGAGTAGSVVAKRLAEDKNLKILLLEAGGDPNFQSILPGLVVYLKNQESVYNFTSKPARLTRQSSRGKNYVINTGKMLGGTSSSNYLSYERGNKEDYDRWVQATKDSSWTYSSLLHFFKKSENLKDKIIKNSTDKKFHGFNGPWVITRQQSKEIDVFLEALKETGNNIVLDLNGNITNGYTRPMFTIDIDGRQSTARAFLHVPLNNLDVLKHTKVYKILIDERKVATGVLAITKNNKKLTLKAKREVIICTGAINTPKLLMLSGVGPQNHLRNLGIPVISNLPVGENYHDHIGVVIHFKLGKYHKPAWPRDSYDFPFPMILGYVALNQSIAYPDYTATSYVVSDIAILQFCAFLKSLDYDLCDTLYKDVKGSTVLQTFIKKTQPKSRGKILLRSLDSKDPPIIDTGIFSDKSDLDDYAKYIRHFIKIRNSTYFINQNAELVDPLREKCSKYIFESDDYWRCYSLSMNDLSGNIVGTCALGSVVDSRLNVIGVKNLRVADASIIPTITISGTCASTAMIGEKAAQMIKDDMKK